MGRAFAPGGLHQYGMVGGRRRAFAFIFRTVAHHDEAYGPADGNVFRLGDFDDGSYEVQWWAPDRLEPVHRSAARCAASMILVTVPDGLRWHRLLKVVPADEAGGP